MKTLILLLSFVSTLGLASQEKEIHACAQLDGFGQIQSRIDFLIRKNNEIPVSINFIHSTFLFEPLIHRKSDNSFVGDKVIIDGTTQSAYSIANGNSEFFTVDSKISNVLKGSASLVPITNQVASMQRFETSVMTSVADVFVTNPFVENVLFQQTQMNYRITLDNGPKSYILKLQLFVDDVGFLSRVYGCAKI